MLCIRFSSLHVRDVTLSKLELRSASASIRFVLYGGHNYPPMPWRNQGAVRHTQAPPPPCALFLLNNIRPKTLAYMREGTMTVERFPR